MILKEIIFSEVIDTYKDIDIAGSLFSGQCFRWFNHLDKDEFFTGIIGHDIVLIRQISPSRIEVQSTASKLHGMDIPTFIRHYFSLDIDTKQLFPDSFMNDHPDLAPLIEDYLSIKILRQFPFETMITFMCAQGIGMPIIRRQVALISEKFGDRSTVLINGKLRSFFSFPSPSRLAEADPELLASCTNNNRTRAANIIAVSKAVMEKRLDLDMLGAGTGSSEAIRHELCLNRGIGLKIADCIALFGFGRFSAFPIDTHVRQYLGKWFMIREADRSLTERNYLFIQEQACRILIPEYAGYAGHILFHCWRKEIRQLKTF